MPFVGKYLLRLAEPTASVRISPVSRPTSRFCYITSVLPTEYEESNDESRRRRHPRTSELVVGTVKAYREYLEAGVYDFARAQLEFPGWLSKLLTHPVTGLENHQTMMPTLTMERGAIKVFVNVASVYRNSCVGSRKVRFLAQHGLSAN